MPTSNRFRPARVLAAVLCAVVVAVAGAARANLVPLDHAAQQCAVAQPAHQGGSRIPDELTAASVWHGCLAGSLPLVQLAAKERLEALSGDARTAAEKTLEKSLKRLDKHVGLFVKFQAKQFLNSVAFGDSDTLNLLKTLVPKLVDMRLLGLRSYRETFGHLLGAVFVWKAELERAFDDGLDLIAQTPGAENTKAALQALKLYALARILIDELDAEEAAIHGIDFEALPDDLASADPDPKGLVKRAVKDVAVGVAALQKIFRKFAKAVDKALAGAIVFEGTKKIKFLQIPSAAPNPTSPGTPITFTVTAEFPGEEWIGFHWDFGDGAQGGGNSTIVFTPVARTHTVMHAYVAPGDYPVRCTVFHGFKSGVFGVGEYKYTRSATFLVRIE